MVAGAILDIGVNTKLTFASHNGVLISVTFPETSGLGPSLGSIRSLAEYVGAKLGDQMTVVLDRSDMSIEASTTDVSQYEPGWELVARLTGIDATRGIEGLASALNCREGEVRSLLLDRGDETVKNALPEPPSSPNSTMPYRDLVLAYSRAEHSRHELSDYLCQNTTGLRDSRR